LKRKLIAAAQAACGCLKSNVDVREAHGLKPRKFSNATRHQIAFLHPVEGVPIKFPFAQRVARNRTPITLTKQIDIATPSVLSIAVY